MKRILFLSLLALLLWSSSLPALDVAEMEKRLEQRYTSLETGDLTLGQAVEHIARGAGIPVVFQVKLPPRKVSVKLVNASLDEALKRVLQPAGFTYTLGKQGIYVVQGKAGGSRLTWREEAQISLRRTKFSGDYTATEVSEIIRQILKKAGVRAEVRLAPGVKDEKINIDFQAAVAQHALKKLMESQKYHYVLQDRAVIVTSSRPPTAAEVAQSERAREEGAIDLGRKKLKEALKMYEKALSLNPNNVKARRELAAIQYKIGKYTEGKFNIDAALKLNPKDKDGYVLRGRILAASGQGKAGLVDLQKAIAIDPYHIEATILAGEVCRRLGLEAKAKVYFRGGIEIYQALSEANSDVYALTGASCLRLGRMEDAANMFTWAFEKKPFHRWGLYYQGLYYLEKKRFTDAHKTFKKLFQADFLSTSALLGMAKAAYGNKDGKTAEKYLARGLKINPKDFQIHFYRGKVALNQGEFAQALSHFQRAHTVKGDHLDTMVHLAAAYKITKQDDRFRRQKIAVLRNHPKLDMDKELARILRGRKLGAVQGAQILAQRGKYREALENYRKILKGDPSNFLAQMGVGKILFITGKYDAARKQFEGVVNKRASEVEAWDYLVRSNLRRGRYGRALVRSKQIVKRFPNLPFGHYLAGRSAYLLGKLSPARNFFQKAAGLDHKGDIFQVLAQAQAHHALNQPHDANEAFGKALEIDPNSTEAYYLQAMLFLEKYEDGYARKLLKKLFKINPHHPRGHVAQALSQLENYSLGNRRFKIIRKHLYRALRVNSRLEEALLARGRMEMMSGRQDRAWKTADKVLATNNRSLTAHALQGAILFESGNKAKFSGKEKKVLSLNPRAAEFYTEIADIVEDHFLYKEARTFAQKAVNLNREYWPAYTILGLNLLRLGEVKKGKEILEMAHKADKFNIRVLNTLQLLDSFDKRYVAYKISKYITIRMDKDEAPLLLPYVKSLLDEVLTKMGKKYDFKIDRPFTLEFYSSHQDFSVRTMGLPFIGALGVCFGYVVVMDSPSAMRPGRYNWGRTMWHEFVHVITLAKTEHQTPRWLTEGISVYEEQARPAWDREYERRFLEVYHQGQMRGIATLNGGFTRPRYRDEVIVSYYQGGLVVDYIVKTWGFDKIKAMLEGYRKRLNTTEVVQKILGVSTDKFDQGFEKYIQKRFANIKIKAKYNAQDLERWRKKVQANPNRADYLAQMAFAQFHNGQVVDAEITAGKALAANPSEGDALAVMGYVEFARGNKKAAREYFAKALKNKTSDGYRINKRLGFLLVQEKKRDKALPYLEKALELYPRDQTLLYNMVKIYDGMGKKDKALKLREEIVKINERDLTTRKYLLAYYRAKNMWDKVYPLAEEGLYINPFNPDYHIALATYFKKKSNWKMALRHYLSLAEITKKRPQAKILVEVAKMYLKLGQKGKAKEYVEKALEANPNHPEAKRLQGEL